MIGKELSTSPNKTELERNTKGKGSKLLYHARILPGGNSLKSRPLILPSH